jgi:glycosyl transferase family 1
MPRRRRVFADTLRRFVPFPRTLAALAGGNRYVKFLLAEEYDSLSYVVDWREAFEASPRLQAELCNVNDAIAFASVRRRIRDFEIIVVLHSAAGDSMSRLRSAHDLERRRCPLLVLFGNEYSLMADKLQFLRDTGAEFVGSQLTPKAAAWLYAGTKAAVLGAPAALNPIVYRPSQSARPIDIGFRGDRFRSELIGDQERARVIEHFARLSDTPIAVDIAYRRVPRSEWSTFLSRCKGTVGAESGTYFLERDDATQLAVTRYLGEHPAATFEEIYANFWQTKTSKVSGKAISSRHFEAAGTKTCQLLVEGSYNGILEADVHYIPVRRDLDDIEDATLRLLDISERTRITEAAYDHVRGGHTYAHRVEHLLSRTIG